MSKRLLLLATASAALVPAAWSVAKTSHEGWPHINGDLKMHSNDQSGTLRATKLRKHNELLGGHGHHTLWGRRGAGATAAPGAGAAASARCGGVPTSRPRSCPLRLTASTAGRARTLS